MRLVEIVEKLGKQDEAILVRELAKEVYPGLLFGTKPSIPRDVVIREDEESGESTSSDNRVARPAGHPRLERPSERTEGRGGMIRLASSMRRTNSEIQITPTSSLAPPLPTSSTRREGERERVPLGIVTPKVALPSGENKHKRKISRSQLK